MSFTEKVDVLDLLINILREHEENLDELVEKLTDALDENREITKIILKAMKELEGIERYDEHDIKAKAFDEIRDFLIGE